MKKILGMFIAIISIFAMFTVPVSAAKGYEGYAIYRDGAFKIPVVLPNGFDWHADYWTNHLLLIINPSPTFLDHPHLLLSMTLGVIL